MKIKTAEATGLQLDWGVAVVLGVKPKVYCGRVETDQTDENYWAVRREFDHTDPAVCMGLIERRNLDVNYRYPLRIDQSVLVSWGDPNDFAYGHWFARGKTLAQAVARCIISMELGDEFECPSELLVQLEGME